jgi:hypothetical protein
MSRTVVCLSFVAVLAAGCEGLDRFALDRAVSQGEPIPMPDELVAPTTRPLPGPPPSFLGRSSVEIIDRISLAAPIGARGTSGLSLSLYLNLEGDDDAAFKPRTQGGQRWNGEIAAYHLGRLLGMDTIPPAVTRDLRAPLLKNLLSDDPQVLVRVEEEAIIDADNTIRGALIYWIPEIHPADIERYGELHEWTEWLAQGATIPPDRGDLARQLSDLIVFDYVEGNWDRWSGGNVYFGPDRRTLLAMDNNASFQTVFSPRIHERLEGPLAQVERFSAVLYRRLIGLNADDLRAELSQDPAGASLLTDEQIAGVLERRDVVVARIERLAARHGHDAVLCFP